MQVYDDRATFLLPRPTWVSDSDVVYCSSCNSAFGPLNRRHHCRNCGNIFCHDCSNRKVPLPQLGYGTKPVRVCNGCFDVAYLVTYSIDEDHGVSTQIHGVRGLLELAEKDDEKDLHNMVVYGGVDALIWLLRSSKYTRLHHLSTTILAMLAEKESIRPVLITKWALAAILIIVRKYTTLETAIRSPNTKKSPASSIHSTATQSVSSEAASTTMIESPQSFLLEIVMNCTHVIYQLSRAGILSQKEVFSDGVFASLLMLASFNTHYLRLENFIVDGSPAMVPAADENDQQPLDNITIIQTLAAKSISAISSLVSFQPNIIQLVQNTKSLPKLLRTSNEDVQKYSAKTVAYLSLRNDKYKSLLLAGEGAPALLSIIVKLPQRDMNDDVRFKDLAYYLSRDIDDIKNEHKNINVQDQVILNSPAVSHACCALANFATNNESQVNLLSQPRLLQYICNVPLVFSSSAEILRHVARCIANLALYEENNEAMLRSNRKFGKVDGYNVLPTLLLISKTSKPDIQRHIVRAIDNLSSNLSLSTQCKGLFNDAYAYIRKFLEESSDSDADVDTYKRAKNIIAREKLACMNQESSSDTVSEDPPEETGEVECAGTPKEGDDATGPIPEEEEDTANTISPTEDIIDSLKTPSNEDIETNATDPIPEEDTANAISSPTEDIIDSLKTPSNEDIETNATEPIPEEEDTANAISSPTEDSPKTSSNEDIENDTSVPTQMNSSTEDEPDKKLQKKSKNKKRSKKHK